MSASSPGTPSNLRRAVISGIGWKAVAEVVVQVTRITALVLMARLLTPRDFGLAGIVMAFGVLIPVLSDLSLGAALIYQESIDDDDKATVFWASAALGVVFTGVGVLASWPLARLFGEPSVQPLFAAFSFSLLFASLAATPLSLLTRRMDFRSLELRLIIATLAGAAVAISMAVAHLGAWALVSQFLVTSFVSLVLMWARCGWLPQFRFSFTTLRRLASYSTAVFGANFFTQLGPAAQNLLAGRLLGAAALGQLVLAYNIVLLPFNRIAAPIQEVLFPAFSRMQRDPQRIASAWLRANQLIAAIALPVLAGLIVVAPDFVSVVLGDRWSSSVTVLRVLSVVGIVQALQRLNFSILQARGRAGSLLWISALAVFAGIVAVVVGSHWGVVGVAVGITISACITQLGFMAITAHAVETRLRSALVTLTGVVVATLVMCAAVIVAQALVADWESASARLVVAIAVGATTYCLTMTVLGRDVIRTVREFMPGRSPRTVP